MTPEEIEALVSKTLFEIEDYLGGNVIGVKEVDMMGLTVFLRRKLTEAFGLLCKPMKVEEIADLLKSVVFEDWENLQDYRIRQAQAIHHAQMRRI